MPKITQIILAVFILTGCGHFDKWTREDKILQGIQLGVQSIDWLQTREMVDDPEYWEGGPLISKDPTKKEVDQVMLASAGLGVIVTHVLPQKCRKYWLSFRIGTASSMVVHNYYIGIRVKH